MTEKEVVFLNQLLIETYSPQELKGVKDRNLLQSALGRPQQSVFGQDAYKTIWLKAAALFESLTQNHPFHNGNKRTGFASMKQFLWLNGFRFTASEEEAEYFTVHIVTEKPSIAEISEWIEKFSISRND
ncbi:type II toxin-antitoxin system death-on-curing family toxin [Salinicoccus sp. HZC-1]|uniref:type II toxin-antitoxin system death-on-curing family toxin n=1 Tax=Salinicoccus sp. HZC-1 TaxID=3385497 RepID=UPI00398A6C6D